MSADPTGPEVVQTLRALNNQFYWLCFNAKVGSTAHSFIEFNGLMSKYIELLAKAVEQGIDPMQLNEHNGVPLPIEDHDMQYLGEKLRCIFGPVIDNNPAARAALLKALFGAVWACPFCGVPPEVKHQHQAVLPFWSIRCLNDDCPVKPSVGKPSREASVAAWTHRTAP